jgi:hypothetical protein
MIAWKVMAGSLSPDAFHVAKRPCTANLTVAAFAFTSYGAAADRP